MAIAYIVLPEFQRKASNLTSEMLSLYSWFESPISLENQWVSLIFIWSIVNLPNLEA